jgi:hypothetical protein
MITEITLDDSGRCVALKGVGLAKEFKRSSVTFIYGDREGYLDAFWRVNFGLRYCGG